MQREVRPPFFSHHPTWSALWPPARPRGRTREEPWPHAQGACRGLSAPQPVIRIGPGKELGLDAQAHSSTLPLLARFCSTRAGQSSSPGAFPSSRLRLLLLPGAQLGGGGSWLQEEVGAAGCRGSWLQEGRAGVSPPCLWPRLRQQLQLLFPVPASAGPGVPCSQAPSCCALQRPPASSFPHPSPVSAPPSPSTLYSFC